MKSKETCFKRQLHEKNDERYRLEMEVSTKAELLALAVERTKKSE